MPEVVLEKEIHTILYIMGVALQRVHGWTKIKEDSVEMSSRLWATWRTEGKEPQAPSRCFYENYSEMIMFSNFIITHLEESLTEEKDYFPINN